MTRTITILIILILIASIGIASAVNSEPTKFTKHGGSGFPTNSFIDSIRNALHLLSIATTCQYGYVYCYENSYIYGDAQAIAREYLSDPYIEGSNLYINYKGDGTKYYIYRGLTSFDMINCDRNGCYNSSTEKFEEVGSNGKYLLDSAPSTMQQGFVFVVWDYTSYNGYQAWTFVAYGWLIPFNYDLSPVSIPTPTPTPAPTLPVTASIKQGNGAIYILTSSTAYGSSTTIGGVGNAGLSYTKSFYNNDKYGIMATPSAGYKLLKVCKGIDCSIVVPYYEYISSPANFDIYFEILSTPVPTPIPTTPTPTSVPIPYSLSISKPIYIIGETVSITACVDANGGHLLTVRPDGGLMYDWQLPVGKCSIANYLTSSTFMRGTYAVKLTDMSNTVKFQNSFQLLDTLPVSTPSPVPSPNIQPPDINTIINALASFLKSLFPSLQW